MTTKTYPYFITTEEGKKIRVTGRLSIMSGLPTDLILRIIREADGAKDVHRKNFQGCLNHLDEVPQIPAEAYRNDADGYPDDWSPYEYDGTMDTAPPYWWVFEKIPERDEDECYEKDEHNGYIFLLLKPISHEPLSTHNGLTLVEQEKLGLDNPTKQYWEYPYSPYHFGWKGKQPTNLYPSGGIRNFNA